MFLIVSAGTAAASSHTGDGGMETETEGEIRVVHASPDAPNVDVYVDGDAVLEDVAFGDVSDYLAVPTGTHNIEITAVGDPDTSVFDQDVEIGESHYTAVAFGELEEGSETPFRVEILEDENSATEEGEARVRAVHASLDAPNVDITVEESGDALLENVSFRDSAYVNVPAGEYTLEIRVAQEDNQGDVVTTFDVNAEAGSVYSAFAVGYVSPDDEPGDQPFEVVTTLDAEPGEAEPTPTSVTFEDQTSDGDSVVVAESSHAEDYVAVVHADDDGAPGDIIGFEGDLDAGTNEEVTVALDETLDAGEHTLHAMLHATSEDGDYGAPLTVDGEVVVESAQVTVDANPSVTFEDQTLGDDGAVDVSVNDASLDQGSWLVVTYEGDDGLIIAGVSQLSDANDVTVTVEDAGGFPGTHTAHVISELSSADYAPGDTVSEETAGNVLVNADAEVTEADGDGGMDDGMDGNGTDDGMDGGDMDGNGTDDGGDGEGDGGDGGQGMPGFTAVAALVALVALVAAALVARRLE